jgi:hypothetical protein
MPHWCDARRLAYGGERLAIEDEVHRQLVGLALQLEVLHGGDIAARQEHRRARR